MFTLRNTQSARFVYHFIPSISRFLNIQRRTLTASVNMKDKFLYIAFPEQPIYFKTQLLADSVKTESRISGGLIKHLNKDAPIYIIFPRTETGSGILENYIRTAIQAQTLYRKSAIWSDLNFAHCLKFSGKRSQTETKSTYKRGVCIYLESGSVFKDSFVEPLLTFLKEHDSDAGKVTMSGEDRLIWQTLGELTEDKEQHPLLCVDRNEAYESSCYESPLFTESELTPVHHTFQEARNVLEKCLDIPEVVELLKITDSHACHSPEKQAPENSLKHPFVVVEGMDATGKTTLTQILETKLGAARYYTPPPQIQNLRPFFDKLPEIVRRAYYCMGNYIVAQEIIKECQTRPVIMDRFWHSTTAYGIANETSSGDLPEKGHFVYQWPADLLKPTLVLFLTVSEDVRKQRLSGRGIGSTFEEKSLDKDQLFRQRLCDSYRRMEEPACFEIDASGTVEEVSSLAQKALEQHGICLENTTTNAAVLGKET